MWLWIIAMIVTLHCVTGAVEEIVCEDTDMERLCYYLVTDVKSWQEANNTCVRNLSGSLVTIDSKDVQDKIEANLDIDIRPWIGAKLVTYDQWQWADNTILGTFSRWDGNNGYPKDNSYVFASKAVNYTWRDDPSSGSGIMSYICEVSNGSCVDSGQYISIPADGRCYYAYKSENPTITWFQAHRTCLELNGLLAKIDTEAVFIGIRSALISNAGEFPDALRGFWIGLHSEQWTWASDGSSLEYDKWEILYPTNNGDCAHLKYLSCGPSGACPEYVWNNDECTSFRESICEQTTPITTTAPPDTEKTRTSVGYTSSRESDNSSSVTSFSSAQDFSITTINILSNVTVVTGSPSPDPTNTTDSDVSGSSQSMETYPPNRSESLSNNTDTTAMYHVTGTAASGGSASAGQTVGSTVTTAADVYTKYSPSDQTSSTVSSLSSDPGDTSSQYQTGTPGSFSTLTGISDVTANTDPDLPQQSTTGNTQVYDRTSNLETSKGMPWSSFSLSDSTPSHGAADYSTQPEMSQKPSLSSSMSSDQTMPSRTEQETSGQLYTLTPGVTLGNTSEFTSQPLTPLPVGSTATQETRTASSESSVSSLPLGSSTPGYSLTSQGSSHPTQSVHSVTSSETQDHTEVTGSPVASTSQQHISFSPSTESYRTNISPSSTESSSTSSPSNSSLSSPSSFPALSQSSTVSTTPGTNTNPPDVTGPDITRGTGSAARYTGSTPGGDVTAPVTTDGSPSVRGLSAGTKAGISVGCIVAAGLIILLIVCLCQVCKTPSDERNYTVFDESVQPSVDTNGHVNSDFAFDNPIFDQKSVAGEADGSVDLNPIYTTAIKPVYNNNKQDFFGVNSKLQGNSDLPISIIQPNGVTPKVDPEEDIHSLPGTEFVQMFDTDGEEEPNVENPNRTILSVVSEPSADEAPEEGRVEDASKFVTTIVLP